LGCHGNIVHSNDDKIGFRQVAAGVWFFDDFDILMHGGFCGQVFRYDHRHDPYPCVGCIGQYGMELFQRYFSPSHDQQGKLFQL